VFVGRPLLYAGAAYGTEGVVRALEMLREELHDAMALCGVTRVGDLDDTYVHVGRSAGRAADEQ
jgi:isopentenyl diphosphate isomerase/L-lactate dehydrogenase-like FMN-dependent dehydrogenase